MSPEVCRHEQPLQSCQVHPVCPHPATDIYIYIYIYIYNAALFSDTKSMIPPSIRFSLGLGEGRIIAHMQPSPYPQNDTSRKTLAQKPLS
jgi:hypothetical protein